MRRISGTALPPGVTGRVKGQIFCRFGYVRIGRSGKNRLPDQPITLTIRWWGDAGPPLELLLAPGSMDEAVFPISCGPKHLTRYLRDMSSLILVLEDSYTHTPIGRCSVDIRFMDVGHPVSGTFPVLMPHDSGGKTGAMRADSGLESTGYALRHVGTIDVHMEIGYHAASNMSSFEINEHLAAQEWRSPRSERQHVGNPEPGSSVSLSHEELRNQPNPLANGGGMLASTELHEVSDVSRFDQALDQLDLFEVLLNRLQR